MSTQMQKESDKETLFLKRLEFLTRLQHPEMGSSNIKILAICSTTFFPYMVNCHNWSFAGVL